MYSHRCLGHDTEVNVRVPRSSTWTCACSANPGLFPFVVIGVPVSKATLDSGSSASLLPKFGRSRFVVTRQT